MAILEVRNLKKIYTTRFGGNQVQALADLNFSVEKGESGGRTFTRVIQLDREARKAELARITGGSQVTPALLESAGELASRVDYSQLVTTEFAGSVR